MQLTPFGNTGLTLSRIGLGLAALGRPGYINLGHQADLPAGHDEGKMRQQTHHILDEAFRSGISYLDAAQSYGKAEEFLSSWLRKENRNMTVGSKWGYYYTANWSVDAEKHEIKEHTLERLDLQWPESEARLAPYLKLYQIHSATFESGVLDNRKVLDRLAEIKAKGYLIGLSVSGPQQGAVIQKALEIKINDELLFGSVQATFNFLESSAGDSLRMAADLGLGVIIKEGVANGRLTSRSNQLFVRSTLKALAQLHGTTPDAIALAYILHQPFVHVVLSGAAISAHLQSNLQSLKVSLSHKEIAALDSLKQTSEAYWSDRSAMAWN